MKFRIIAALCCLFIAGGGLMAQDRTAPLPPPDIGTTTPPPPGTDSSTLPSPGSVEQTPAAGPRRRGSRTERPPRAATQRTTPPASAPSQSPGSAQAGSQQAAAAQAQDTASVPVRKRGLYGGFTSGISFASYHDTDKLSLGDDDAYIMPEAGGFLGVHLGNLGIQLEVLVAFDNVVFDKGASDEISFFGMSLLVPLIFKYDIKLGSFVIQPLVGVYYNAALGDMNVYGSRDGKTPYANPPLGMTVGGDFGWNLRRGMLFLDARFAWDLGKTVVPDGGDSEKLWRKSAFTLALGYQFN